MGNKKIETKENSNLDYSFYNSNLKSKSDASTKITNYMQSSNTSTDEKITNEYNFSKNFNVISPLQHLKSKEKNNDDLTDDEILGERTPLIEKRSQCFTNNNNQFQQKIN